MSDDDAMARVGQGVGAALVVPTTLALLNGGLRASDRARAIGIWAGLTTLAATIGPYVGGWLVDHVSWRWVSLISPPPRAAGAVPRLRPARHPPRSSRLIRRHLDPGRSHGRLDHRFTRAA